jgi:TFIIF-interacting CTD phosphatase-like protein
MNVILDLDSTLINSVEPKNLSAVDPKATSGLKYFDFIHNGVFQYRIFARPHLQDFLDYLFKNFNVAVFTAADKEYAYAIIKKFILTRPNRKLDFIFTRYHFEQGAMMYQKAKPLDMIFNLYKRQGYTPDNTYIIDDLSDVWQANPKNTVHAPAFEILKHSNGKYNFNPECVSDKFLKEIPGLLEYYKATSADSFLRYFK